VTDSDERYFAKPTDIPGCFTLWDRRSDTAVYGGQLAGKRAVDAFAQRLNDVYRQFINDPGNKGGGKQGSGEALGNPR
jgi:hypothetical protein